MLTSYLKIAFRNLRRNKGYAFINIAGLAVGLTVCLIIALFVRHETSYDDFHEKSDRIYRLTHLSSSPNGEGTPSAGQAAPMGPLLQKRLPEVQQAVRFQKADSRLPHLIQHGDRQFYETGVLYADSNVFDVFSFRLLRGHPERALTRPYTLVLTRQMAEKYFPNQDPLGKTLTIGAYKERRYEVTGVVENPPSNSTIQFSMLASFNTLYQEQGRMMRESNGGWSMESFPTYLLLDPEASPETVKEKLPNLLNSHNAAPWVQDYTYRLEALSSIYLHSRATQALGPYGDPLYVWTFSLVALLVLCVASANYMNLSTARSLRRAREVGIRKTLGAHRLQLVRQFLGESMLVSAVALFIALALAQLLVPVFTELTGVALEASYWTNPVFMLALLGGAVLLGGISGSYPALVLSRFQAAEVVKGYSRAGRSGARLRKGLVVFQFVVSAVLLSSTIVAWKQLDYMQEKKLGLEEERVAVVKNLGVLTLEQAQTLKKELLKSTKIAQVSVADALPTQMAATRMVKAEGRNEALWMTEYGIDQDYLETLSMQLKAGRDLSGKLESDATGAVLVNEAAARKIGWKEPIGKKITYNNKERTVVGVVEDFHLESLHQGIKPVYMVRARWGAYVTVRVQPGQVEGALEGIRQSWSALAPEAPLDYFFLDEAFDRLYRSEERVARIFGLFFTLALFIACLGLFGLAAYTAEQRTKEIGIRKVCGASLTEVVLLLMKGLARLIVVAIVIAVPVAYVISRQWLADFAFHIELGAGPFLLTAGLVLTIALATAGYQAVKAALINPAKAIRYE